MPYLFLLFIIMPIIEIALLIQVGSAIGLWPTLAIIVTTAVLGTWLLRQQGLATLMRARGRLSGGEMPGMELAEAALLLVGGVLLLTPGLITDAFGFACLIPHSRRAMARGLIGNAWIRGHATVVTTGVGGHTAHEVGQGQSDGARVGDETGTFEGRSAGGTPNRETLD